MRPQSNSDLIEALAAWGKHEASGQMKDKVSFDLTSKQLCADFALRHRAPLVSAILSLDPMQTIITEFDAAESEVISLYNGLSIDEWLVESDGKKDKGWKHVQEMVSGTFPYTDPLIATATYRDAPAPIGPIRIWDGCHRAAAWRRLFLNGKPSTISAYLILTAK